MNISSTDAVRQAIYNDIDELFASAVLTRPPRNDQHAIKIAIVDRGDRGHASNKTIVWKDLRQRLAEPLRDQDHTVAEYQAMTVDQKGALKDVGAFVGGPVREGVRKRENMIERTLVTLDMDAVTADQVDELRLGLSELAEYELFASTTRSHTKAAQRWRIVIPLTRSVTADEYAPLARILASKALMVQSEAMDAIDDVSYRVAQIMYWPSVNRDGPFDFFHNPGQLVDPDAVLTAFGEWRDWTQLPYSDKRVKKRPAGTVKAENPTEKRGFVGAFCRAYSVPAAIAKFLPDIYVDVDKRGRKWRYTYAKGSGSHGAVVEDDGLFLYSNHGTDPCGERLVNSFDLVRLHLFGDLVKNQEATDPRQEPSFKAMQDRFAADGLVAKELLVGLYDFDAMFEDVEDDHFKLAAKDLDIDEMVGNTSALVEWTTGLDKEPNGVIRSTLPNILAIIQNDPRLKGCVQRNEFTAEIVSRRTIRTKSPLVKTRPVNDNINGDLWTDQHDDMVRSLLEIPRGPGQAGYGLRVTDRDLRSAVNLTADKNAFHPVREYLRGLSWDGIKRLETLFIRYLGAPDTAYTRAIARLTLVGAVTRVFEPGHKFDFVTILEGLQGKGKSTFIATLARNWFVEIEGDLHDRKGLVERMQGAWIAEIPELSGFSRADVQAIKATFSASKDKVRLSYDRRSREFQRQCIFIGSTNDAEYLRDPTGGRRFWPIVCHVQTIDIASLKPEVDQLWAEAFALYKAMRREQSVGTLPLYLTNAEAKAEALAMQESRRIQTAEDTYAGIIGAWLDVPVSEDLLSADSTGFSTIDVDQKVLRTQVCLVEIWCECLRRDRNLYRRPDTLFLSGAMQQISGWERVSPRNCGRYGKQQVYQRAGATKFPYEMLRGGDITGIVT